GDGRAAGSGLDAQVLAEPAGDPQPHAAGGEAGRAGQPGWRLRPPGAALVADLDHELAALVPDARRGRRCPVEHGVGRHLAHRDHELGGGVLVHAEAARLGRGHPADVAELGAGEGDLTHRTAGTRAGAAPAHLSHAPVPVAADPTDSSWTAPPTQMYGRLTNGR